MIVLHPLCYEDKTDGGSNIAEAADMMTVTAKRQTGVSASGCRHVCEWQFPTRARSLYYLNQTLMTADDPQLPLLTPGALTGNSLASQLAPLAPGQAWRSTKYEHDVTGNSQ